MMPRHSHWVARCCTISGKWPSLYAKTPAWRGMTLKTSRNTHTHKHRQIHKLTRMLRERDRKSSLDADPKLRSFSPSVSIICVLCVLAETGGGVWAGCVGHESSVAQAGIFSFSRKEMRGRAALWMQWQTPSASRLLGLNRVSPAPREKFGHCFRLFHWTKPTSTLTNLIINISVFCYYVWGLITLSWHLKV